jgi:hypothetical protein
MKKLIDLLNESNVNLTTEQKSAFLEEIKGFSAISEAVYRNSRLKEVAKQLTMLAEKAEQVTLSETEEWFDQVTVKRNMKELKNGAKTFNKTVDEINVLQQRLESIYEEMGNTLSRYYEI